MADVAEFDAVWAEEFEDDAVGSINAKAPDFVMFGAELLRME